MDRKMFILYASTLNEIFDYDANRNALNIQYNSEPFYTTADTESEAVITFWKSDTCVQFRNDHIKADNVYINVKEERDARFHRADPIPLEILEID